MSIKLNVTPSGVIVPFIDKCRSYTDIFQPVEYKEQNVYLIGNSNIMGIRHDVKYSISSYLNDTYGDYSFKNYGIPYSDILNMYTIVRSYVPDNSICIIELNSRIILRIKALFEEQVIDKKNFYLLSVSRFECLFLELLFLLYKKNIKVIFTTIEAYNGRCLKDRFCNILSIYNQFITTADDCDADIHHLSISGNRRYGDFLYKLIVDKKFTDLHAHIENLKILYSNHYSVFKEEMDIRTKICFNILKFSDNYNKFIEYLKCMRDASSGVSTKGLICGSFNPPTLGHKYLLEYAASKVDLLYVIYMQNDKLFFSNENRLDMLKFITEDISNVEILESCNIVGNEIITSDYIFKDETKLDFIDFSYDNSIIIDNLMDILDISVRFFGEEPHDRVTQKYFDDFKKNADIKGKKSIIIPRMEINGEVISASYIRKLYINKSPLLRNYVTEKVYNYIKELQ